MCCPHSVGALPFQVGEGLRPTTFEFLSVWLRVYQSEERNKGHLMNTLSTGKGDTQRRGICFLKVAKS